MKELTKKVLRSAGILCAIGAVGGLVIAGVNVVTAPVISEHAAQKAAAAYQAIFAETQAVSDTTSVSGKYVSASNIAYKDTAKTQEIGTIYTGSAINGSHMKSAIEIMVGFSKDSAGKTVYGKIVILANGATAGYDTKVANTYVGGYNSAPSSETLSDVTCGATEAATAVKMIVDEALSIFESGGAVEDIDSEIKSLFPSEAAYSDPIDLSGKTYATKYYAVYSDAAKTSYLGTAYRLSGTTSDGKALTLLGGFSGTIASPDYGKIVVAKSTVDLSADVASYNAAPSASQFDSWSAATSGALAKAMMAEASGLYYSDGVGNLTFEGNLLQVYPGLKGYSDPVSVSGRTYVSKYYLIYSDAAKTTEMGRAYFGSGSTTWDNEAGESDTVSISLLVGIKGTSSSPVLGKLSLVSDNSAYNDKTFVSDYNTSPSESPNVVCGATKSATLIRDIVLDALASFKGGN
jgi:Na+-translocating ferredoxin:NAD+ oxidoreductase RnfG subunit